MKTKKGFTLVELLIVIMVIGVLSSMMMISSTESITSAKASDIITGLNNIKIAALAHYVDSFDKYNSASPPALDIENIKPYLNNGNSLPSGYGVENNNKSWFATYKFSDSNTEIKSKLASRAQSSGLIAGTSDTNPSTNPYTNGDTVYLQIR